MKKHLIRITGLVVAAAIIVTLVFISSCNKGKGEKEATDVKSTYDEVIVSTDSKAIESSSNVNGMRFGSTLEDFTTLYNECKRNMGENDLIMLGNWQKHGKETADDNGVKIQYYYYDDDNTNFTATVEVDTNKILNIGFGTTMRYFMGQTDGKNNDDSVLEKAALMAQCICKYENGSTDVLKNIFKKPPWIQTILSGSRAVYTSSILRRTKRTAKIISCCSEYSRFPKN